MKDRPTMHLESTILIGIAAAVLYCTWPAVAALFLMDYYKPLKDAQEEAKAEWYA